MNSFRVSFEMTVLCNYSCSYCDAHGTKPFPEVEEVLKVITNVFRLDKPKVSFYFLGGEPTIYPHLREVLNEIFMYEDRVGEVLIQTNLSRPKSYFSKLAAEFPKLKLCASFQNHQTKNFESYLTKLSVLKELGNLEGCDVMMEYLNPGPLKEKIKRIQELGIEPDLRVIDYRSNTKNKIRDLVYSTAYSGMIKEEELDNRSWDGYLCNAGWESLVIDNNFEAYPCFSAYYKKEQYSIPSLGHIIHDFEKIKEQVKNKTICKWGSCSCEPDRMMARRLV